MERSQRAIAGALIFALFAACSTPGPANPLSQPSSTVSSGPKPGGTLVVALGRDPVSGNMDTNADTNGFYAFTPVFSSLVELRPDGSVAPDLAEKWTISADGLRYEFKLSAARFHDGKPVTSADVKYAAEEVAGRYAPKFVSVYRNVARVEALDDSTVVFVLKEPSAVFIAALAHHSFVILPKHIYAGTDPRTNPQNQAPIGSGPFKFKEWVKGDHLTLVRNDDYFRKGLPYLDQVIFRITPDASSRSLAFQKGDIDVMTGQFVARQNTADLRQLTGVQVSDSGGFPGEELLQFNTTRKPFDNVAVRQALAYAIDRKAVAEKAFFGAGALPSTSHVPIQLKTFHDPSVELPARDVGKAGALLDAAGLPKGSNGIRTSIRLAYDVTSDADKLTAEVIRDNLKDVGVQVQLTPLESATSDKAVYQDADFDLWTGSFTSNGDPELGLARFYTTKSIKVSAANASRYSDAQVDQLFAQGASATDLKARQAAYNKVQQILLRDLPTLPLVDYTNIDFVRSNVGGVPENPVGYPQFNVQRLWLR